MVPACARIVMKKLVASFVVLGLAASVVFAFLEPYYEKKVPPISLPDAYILATQALGAATNTFYCLHANTQVSRSQDGEWLFDFCATNGDHKFVFIYMDKNTKPQVFDRLPPA